MTKHVALLVIILILSLSSSALAAEPGSGIIDGMVANETADGSSVADQDVTLKTYLNDVEEDSTTTKTDAEGYFVFDGLSTEPGYSYEVTLTFQQADYYSERLSFDEGETTAFTEVIVYDSTTSDEAIKAATAHTIIYVEQGSLRVVEYIFFVNEGDRTYIGSKEVGAEGTKETLRFSLPKEATELQPDQGLMECCIYSSEDGFVDTMPVLPGGKEIVYSYRVDYNSGAYTFSQNVSYPIVNYNLLVQGEGSRVASDQLTTEGTLDIEGVLFNHLSGTDLAVGNILTTRLSGLPETNNQNTAKWVGLVLLILIAGFSFGYLLRKRRLQPISSEDTLEQKKQSLLVKLAKLDDEFEGGQISDADYRRQRAATKAQLVKLLQRTKEISGNR